MTLSEARKILGLGPDDDPRPFLNEFKEARERIAGMVRSAPNETLANRYQQGLTDFDQALAAVREHLEAIGLAPRSQVAEAAKPEEQAETPPKEEPAPVIPVVVAPEVPEVVEAEASPEKAPDTETTPPAAPAALIPEVPAVEKTAAGDEPVFVSKRIDSLPASAPPLPKAKTQPDAPQEYDDEEEAPGKSRRAAKVAWLMTVILLGIAGSLFYLKNDDDLQFRKKEELITLDKKGHTLIDNRSWPEAIKVFDQIEKLEPKSALIPEGRRRIAEGMAEEQSQFVGYWSGQAKASFEAKRWDEAASAAQQVLDRFPNEKEPAELLKQIAEARTIEADRLTLSSARDLLQQRKWDDAMVIANKILSTRPNDEEAKTLLQDAGAAKEKAAADLAKARALLEQARARDNGQFDQQTLDWLREASALSPEDAEIKAQLEKIASYARTIRVPGDFATPAEALAQARDRDRIIVAAGTWEGPLLVNASVDLQGAGADTTLVQCAAQKGNCITLGPDAKGAHITGFSFRHESFDAGEERYSAALVRAVTVDFVDCRFFDASGHGLAVIEGGHAVISRCRFFNNGWNGIAASGPGTLLEVRQSEAIRNFGHGIESWDGAAIILTDNRCEENSRNGIHADNGGGSVTLEKNQLIGNREFGLVLSSAGSGKGSGNTARGNLLGGFVIRSTASAVAFSGNEATKNTGPGLVLDMGLLASTYSGNLSTGNEGQQILSNANLTVKDEAAPEAPAPNPTTPPKALPVLEGQ